VVVGKLVSLSSKLLPAKEEGGGKYQPIEVVRQQGNKAMRCGAQGSEATNGGD
jgi:hypothetical protein